MIKVTRLNQTELTINADLIEFVEQTPDTVITMVTGRKILARESADDITQRVVAYRQRIGPYLPHPSDWQPQTESEKG